MHLVRDVLDKPIVDRNRREVGRTDGVVLAMDSDSLSVRALRVGLAVLGYRLHPAVGRFVEGMQWTVHAESAATLSVPFADVESIDGDIKLKRSLTELKVADGWTGAHPELTLESLLGREVRAANNHAIGRLEEFRAVQRGRECVVTAYIIGTAGLQQRLGLGVRRVFGLKAAGHVARWDQLDLTDHKRPRLTCPFSELEELSG
jgi:sporulation protein YlmC with PRC-barrel domain